MNQSDVKFFLLIGLVAAAAFGAYALTKKKIDAKEGTEKWQQREIRFVHPTTPGAQNFDQYMRNRGEELRRR